MLRWLTAGESHGPALVAVLDGVPAGIEVTSAEVSRELARRRLGYGRGARMAFEQDEVDILGGLRHGHTLGSPVAIRIGNSEWPKWETVMAADPVDPEALAGQARNAPLTRPRPGHADLVISTVPKGVADPVRPRWRPGTVLFDALYDPWPTPLAAAAQAAGLRIVSGLDLLLAQAVHQFTLFTGLPAPVTAMDAALREAAAQR